MVYRTVGGTVGSAPELNVYWPGAHVVSGMQTRSTWTLASEYVAPMMYVTVTCPAGLAVAVHVPTWTAWVRSLPPAPT